MSAADVFGNILATSNKVRDWYVVERLDKPMHFCRLALVHG